MERAGTGRGKNNAGYNGPWKLLHGLGSRRDVTWDCPSTHGLKLLLAFHFTNGNLTITLGLNRIEGDEGQDQFTARRPESVRNMCNQEGTKA